MRGLTKHWIVLLLTISSLCHAAWGQDGVQVRALAMDAMAQGDYAGAEILWMRLDYFLHDKGDVMVQHGLAECRYQLGRWEEAADGYEFVANLVQSDSLEAECRLRVAAARLQCGQAEQARARLLAWGPQLWDGIERRRQFYLGAAALAVGESVMAEAHWQGCLKSDSARTRLSELMVAWRRVAKRPNWVPPLLSLLVPGAGQVYLGHPGRALRSVVLLGAIVVGGVYVGMAVAVGDALLLWLPTYVRYYAGGAVVAGRDARAQWRMEQDGLEGQMLELLGEGSGE